jgi:branched-chain amino acid transport system permease protein
VLEALVAGCALGGVYALASCGIVITYLSSGVLNFAFAALAFFIARLYYFLLVQHGWSITEAALASIVVVGPILGAVLWLVLFRFIRLASPAIKIVVTIGLSVCVAPITILLFGDEPIVSAPGLSPLPERVFTLAGTNITLDQMIVYGCVLLFVLGGAAILRWTDAGLLVRAVVDSEAMSGLSGIRSPVVAVSVWSVSTFLAGVVGVLAAPIIGLDIGSFTVIIAASFAAVIAARLRSVTIAIVVSLLMGIATEVIERYMSTTSQFTADVIPSIPFAFIVLFLIYSTIRGRAARDDSTGGPLDRAVAPQGGSEAALARAATVARSANGLSAVWLPIAAVVVVAILPLVLQGLWVGMVALGLAYAVIFLSYTLVVGEAGMIWLCVPTFAGIGAFTTAELATVHGWPVLAALVVGGVFCTIVGVLIGFATIRLGDLYVALVTLTFALLVENLVFGLNSLFNYGAGVSLSAPAFAQSDRVLSWLFLAIFCILAAVVANIRRSTFGLAVAAVRWSEPAARMTGLSVVRTKVAVSAIGAGIAGIGGGLLAIYLDAAVPSAYSTFTDLVWLAVLVTVGSRSNSAALIAGLMFSFVPEIMAAYLPTSWGEVPPALFGLGAVLVARNPEGVLAMHARQLQQLVGHRRRLSSPDAREVTEQVRRVVPSKDLAP